MKYTEIYGICHSNRHLDNEQDIFTQVQDVCTLSSAGVYSKSGSQYLDSARKLWVLLLYIGSGMKLVGQVKVTYCVSSSSSLLRILYSLNGLYTLKALESLTANFLAVMREMASGVIPSICSFTRADMAMSGIPAVNKKGKDKITTNKTLL